MRVDARAAECPSIPAAFLEEEQRTHTRDGYRVECCREFVEGALTDKFVELPISKSTAQFTVTVSAV